MLGLGALAFAVCYAILGLTTLVVLSAGRERAFALGLMASQRNIGLMVAATGNALPELTWLLRAMPVPYLSLPAVADAAGASSGEPPALI